MRRCDIINTLAGLPEGEFADIMHEALKTWTVRNCGKFRAIYLRNLLRRWRGAFFATLNMLINVTIVGDEELSERLGKVEPVCRSECQPWYREEQ